MSERYEDCDYDAREFREIANDCLAIAAGTIAAVVFAAGALIWAFG